jgi:hypothetical protein
VESAHWWWEQRFESRFRLDPVVSVERLCDEATAFAARLCKTEIHSRTRAPRTAHWEFHINRSFETQLRVPNCDFSEAKRFAVSPAKIARVGGSGVIEFRGNRYRVPEPLLHERNVSVSYSPFEFPSVYVKAVDNPTAPLFLCEPIAVNEHGFPLDGVVIGTAYKAQKHGDRAASISGAEQTLRDMGVKVGEPKYIRRNASGEAERFVTRGYHLEGLEASGIKSREAALEVSPVEPIYNKFQARDMVRQALGGRAFTPAEVRYLTRFGDQVTEQEIDDAVTALRNGVAAPVVALGS